MEYRRTSDALAALAEITLDSREAKSLVKEALEVSPNNVWAIGLYCHLLASEGRFDRALTFWQSRREYFPRIVYNFETAKLLKMLGRDREAQEALQESLNECNTDDERQMDLERWERGDDWSWPMHHLG